MAESPISIGVHSKTSNSTNALTTAGLDTTAGSTLVAFVTWYDPSSTIPFTSFTDSNSNTWIQIQTEEASGTERSRGFYCTSGTRGTGHTFTLNINTAAACSIFILEIKPAVGYTISLDQSDRRRDTSTPYTLASGLTTTDVNEILVTFQAGDSGSNPSTITETGLGSSTIQDSETDGANRVVSALATQIVTSIGTFNPSWTQSNSTQSSVWLATFKAVAAGGTTITLVISTLTLTAQAINLNRKFQASLTAAQLSMTAQAINLNRKFQAALTNAQVIMTAQALNLNRRFQTILTAAQLSMTAQAVNFNRKFQTSLTSAQLALIAQAVNLNRRFQTVLTAATVAFSAKPITFNAKTSLVMAATVLAMTPTTISLGSVFILSLIVASFSFSPKPLASQLLMRLTTAAITFTTNLLKIQNVVRLSSALINLLPRPIQQQLRMVLSSALFRMIPNVLTIFVSTPGAPSIIRNCMISIRRFVSRF